MAGQLLIRLDPAAKAALRKAAFDNRRSMAFIMGEYAEECLRRDGYLPKTKKPRA